MLLSAWQILPMSIQSGSKQLHIVLHVTPSQYILLCIIWTGCDQLIWCWIQTFLSSSVLYFRISLYVRLNLFKDGARTQEFVRTSGVRYNLWGYDITWVTAAVVDAAINYFPICGNFIEQQTQLKFVDMNHESWITRTCCVIAC